MCRLLMSFIFWFFFWVIIYSECSFLSLHRYERLENDGPRIAKVTEKSPLVPPWVILNFFFYISIPQWEAVEALGFSRTLFFYFQKLISLFHAFFQLFLKFFLNFSSPGITDTSPSTAPKLAAWRLTKPCPSLKLFFLLFFRLISQFHVFFFSSVSYIYPHFIFPQILHPARSRSQHHGSWRNSQLLSQRFFFS